MIEFKPGLLGNHVHLLIILGFHHNTWANLPFKRKLYCMLTLNIVKETNKITNYIYNNSNNYRPTAYNQVFWIFGRFRIHYYISCFLQFIPDVCGRSYLDLIPLRASAPLLV